MLRLPSTEPVYDSDLDGNKYTFNNGSGYEIDTIGRKLYPATPSSYITTDVSSHCPNLGVTGQAAGAYAIVSPVDTWNTSTADPRYTYTVCYTGISYATDLWGDDGHNMTETWATGDGISWNELSGGFSPIQSVVLPDGTYWGFVYDNIVSGHPFAYGNVTKIIKPTGGAIAYCYSQNGYMYGVFAGVESGTPIEQINLPLLTKRAEESVSDSYPDACTNDGLSTTNYWTYNISPWGGIGTSTATSATVTDPLGNQTVYAFDRPGQTSESIYSGTATGTPLKYISTTYSSTTVPVPFDDSVEYPALSAFPHTETTSLNGSTVGSTVSTYSPTYYGNAWGCEIFTSGPPFSACIGLSSAAPLTLGQLHETDIKDGSGTLLQSTTTTFVSDSSSTYFNDDLLDLPASVVVSDGTNSKETDYAYDESTYSSGGTKGHQTTTTYGTGLSSHTYWASTLGLIDHVVDIQGETAGTYSYDTSYYTAGGVTYYAALQPTSIASPLGASDGYTYDITSGQVTSHTDLNGQTTALGYDVMRRPWKIQYPDAHAISSTGQSAIACYT